jgi:DNA-directed RNA polymerase specialized sigma24 family protein
VGKRKHYPKSHQIAVPLIDEDGEETDPVDTIPDDRPGPEEITITFDELRRRPQLLREALAAIRDPRHREAVILHWLRGWPITDKDKTKPTLEQRFGKSARQIQNWINAAFNDMRAAIGEKK